MKKIFKTFFALIICLCLTILFNTCKKYPDGGFTKRGPKNILGGWTLDLYEVNGIDSTDLINYNGDDEYKKILFIKENTKYSPHLYCRINEKCEMIVDFSDNNKNISFLSNQGLTGAKYCGSVSLQCYRLIFTPEGAKTQWQITKLKKKEIVLTSSQTNSYQIKLSKQ